MKMNKNIQSVWAQLSKAKEVELSSEEVKVELALVDDLRARHGAIQSELSKLTSTLDELSGVKQKIQKMISSLSDEVYVQQKEINKASLAMDELGVDKSSLKYLNDQVGDVLQKLKRAQNIVK